MGPSCDLAPYRKAQHSCTLPCICALSTPSPRLAADTTFAPPSASLSSSSSAHKKGKLTFGPYNIKLGSKYN